MRRKVAVPILLGLVAVACGLRSAHGDEAPPFSEVRTKCTRAFKPLSLPKPKALEKALRPRLPSGIVIESGPFDQLIAHLLKTHAGRLADRAEALGGLVHHPTPPAGKLIKAALQVLAKERVAWAERVEAAEEDYAEVYNQGYMESGEGVRQTRKMAAVLIPFFRTLMARADALEQDAIAALAAMKTGDGLAWLVDAARTDGDATLRAAAATALGRVGGAAAFGALTERVTKDDAAAVRQAALLALTAWPVGEMKASVIAALSDAAWTVRALAIAMTVRARLVEATEPLIEALQTEEGRLRRDIDDALYALVGVRMYADVDRWKRWWAENAEVMKAKAQTLAKEGAYDVPLGPIEGWPQADAAEEADRERRGGTTVFYGIETWSKRIVYVVDISRSMDSDAAQTPPKHGDARHPYAEPRGGSKIAIARWQLHRAVHDLPEDAAFNIVVYSESYAVWQPAMVQAKDRAKDKAHEFIDKLNANGTTNICDSLDKALEMAAPPPATGRRRKSAFSADTVYLLSDGDPNRGRVTDLGALLEDFVRRNRLARVVVHAIGIGEVAGSSFLADLARKTGGHYVGFR